MAQTDNHKKRITQGSTNIRPQALIRCKQINLKHSKRATDNIMHLTEQDNSDVIFIQEPYLYQNRMAGIKNLNRYYISHKDKSRAAIIITNNKIDALLIKQISTPDSTLIELKYNNTRFFAASMYFDITKETERDLDKTEGILEFTKGKGFIIVVDRNAISKAWHDSQTNKRGRILEEYITSKNLHIMNEESQQTTFQNKRGSSNIDLTLVNNQLRHALKNWEISIEKSCSDHNIIKFEIGQDTNYHTEYNYNGRRYVVTDGSL
jgi:hypothetical protein